MVSRQTAGDKNKKNGPATKNSPTKKPKKTATTSYFTFDQKLAVIVVLLTALIFSAFHLGRFPWQENSHSVSYLDRIAVSVGLQRHQYAIMFDAGSTGSRILVFKFHLIRSDGSVKLDKEYFEEIKPGLSYYASNPSEAADSLRPLLEKAKSQIPPEFWGNTPLVLKATAGLRLLPGHKAESILEEVRKLFKEYPFHVHEDSVDIMEGSDEGLFSWFTVNFLLDTLNDISKTSAVLDLGGGSTQVAFAAEELSSAPPDHIHTYQVFSKPVKLYIHSYLGLGLMAARLDILTKGNSTNTPKGTTFHSPCLHASQEINWEYARKHYVVGGKDVPSSKNDEESNPRFDECFNIASKVVNSKVFAPKELEFQQVYAISYYYDRASDSGLIDPLAGGKLTVGRYIDAARTACKTSNDKRPFLCLDMSFISAFLSQGLGLAEDKQLMLRKKITDSEISWALGAAIQVLADKNTRS